jgi:hypothetical protein
MCKSGGSPLAKSPLKVCSSRGETGDHCFVWLTLNSLEAYRDKKLDGIRCRRSNLRYSGVNAQRASKLNSQGKGRTYCNAGTKFW